MLQISLQVYVNLLSVVRFHSGPFPLSDFASGLRKPVLVPNSPQVYVNLVWFQATSESGVRRSVSYFTSGLRKPVPVSGSTPCVNPPCSYFTSGLRKPAACRAISLQSVSVV
jgi:hypothetical protein